MKIRDIGMFSKSVWGEHWDQGKRGPTINWGDLDLYQRISTQFCNKDSAKAV